MHQVIQININSSWVMLAVVAGALGIVITILEIMLYVATKKRNEKSRQTKNIGFKSIAPAG